MKKNKSDLKGRILVLVGLTLFVFVPICYSPVLCCGLFYFAMCIGALEWLNGMRSEISKHEYVKISYGLISFLVWFLPTMYYTQERIFGEHPGHHKSMEAIAIVLLVSDSAQLGCGRYFGKTRVVPFISPNKTLEGYLGGLCVTCLYGKLVHQWNFDILVFTFIGGVFGDLYFSLAKRIMGIKDFSKILGPHGGVCDRIDSYVFAWAVISHYF